MKKIISIILALVLALSMVACGAKEEAVADETAVVENVETEEASVAEEAEVETKEVTISTFDLSKLSNKIDLMMMDSKLCIVSNGEAFFAETKEDIFISVSTFPSILM